MTQALEAPVSSVPPSDTLLVIDGFILDSMMLPSCVLLLLVARCFRGQLCCTLTMLQMSCHLHTRRVLVKLDCHAVSSSSACSTMSAQRADFLWVALLITIVSSWTFFDLLCAILVVVCGHTRSRMCLAQPSIVSPELCPMLLQCLLVGSQMHASTPT